MKTIKIPYEWITYKNEIVNLNNISHQHISNVYWFMKLIYNHDDEMLRFFILCKFGWLRSYFPQIPQEIAILKYKGCVRNDRYIMCDGIIGRIGN